MPENYRDTELDHIKKATGQPPGPQDGPMLLNARFRDMAQLGRLAGWDTDFRQLDPGPLLVDARLRADPILSILRFRFSRSLHQVGASPKGFLTLGIPMTDHLHDWEGRSIRTPPFLSFGSGHWFDSVSAAAFSGFTVSIALDHAYETATALGLTIPDTELGAFILPGVTDPGALASTVHELDRLVCGEAVNDPQNDTIASLLSLITRDDIAFDKSTLQQRSRAVSRALDMMANDDGEPLSMRDICLETGVSLRCLQRGFKDRFGIGPKAYYLRLRLSRVRSCLLSFDGRIPIADAANASGFWHMGQFAKDYRKLFGELPSQTVA